MNYESNDSQAEQLEKIPTAVDKGLDNEKFNEGEVSEASLMELARADKNIAEIVGLDEGDVVVKLEKDPAKAEKVANLLTKAKGWAATIVGAAAMAGSVVYSTGTNLESLTEMQTVNLSSSAGIAAAMIVLSAVFTVGSIFYKSYKESSSEYDAKQAEKAAKAAKQAEERLAA